MDLKEELGRVMRQYVDKNIVAGVNLLVEKDGQEICYCQAGLADRENGKEITRDTIFRLYSQTKPVTAAAAMILMERGKLELCQPVSDFLPSFREQKVCCGSTLVKLEQAGRSMMVQDLLRMTSGLEYMGVKVDPEKNNCRGKEVDVSAEGATVHTLVIPTNEELVIARETLALIK